MYQLSSMARYTLVQVFSKYGAISKLDYLFHKAGPLKGKPRGYAFIEYSNRDVRHLSSSYIARHSSRVSCRTGLYLRNRDHVPALLARDLSASCGN